MRTIEVADRTAHDLELQAKACGLSVSELVELMADQFLTDRGPVFELSDDQIAQIKRNMDDPRPSIPHEQVMAGVARLLDGDE